MNVKSLFASKTFWFGIAQIAFAAIGLYTGGMDTGTATALFFTGLGSIGLRLNTSQPVSVV
jgi:hypothetical protein